MVVHQTPRHSYCPLELWVGIKAQCTYMYIVHMYMHVQCNVLYRYMYKSMLGRVSGLPVTPCVGTVWPSSSTGARTWFSHRVKAIGRERRREREREGEEGEGGRERVNVGARAPEPLSPTSLLLGSPVVIIEAGLGGIG